MSKKPKKTTILQVHKAVVKYANENGEYFTQVSQRIDTTTCGEVNTFFIAYINGFGTFAEGQTIADIIKKFDDVKNGKRHLTTRLPT